MSSALEKAWLEALAILSPEERTKFVAKRWDPGRDWEKKQAKREDAKECYALAEAMREHEKRCKQAAAVASAQAQQQSSGMAGVEGWFKPDASFGPGTVYYDEPMAPSISHSYTSASGDWTVQTFFDEVKNDYRWVAFNSRTGECKPVHFGDLPKPETIVPKGTISTDWLKEAHGRCMASDMVIRLQLEDNGVVLIGTQGDDYETRSIPWTTLEEARQNPIIAEIEVLERQLSIVSQLKTEDGKRKQAA